MEGDKTIERKREEESVEQREKMQERRREGESKRERGKESRENIRTTAQLCTAEAEDPTGGTTVSISGQT